MISIESVCEQRQLSDLFLLCAGRFKSFQFRIELSSGRAQAPFQWQRKLYTIPPNCCGWYAPLLKSLVIKLFGYIKSWEFGLNPIINWDQRVHYDVYMIKSMVIYTFESRHPYRTSSRSPWKLNTSTKTNSFRSFLTVDFCFILSITPITPHTIVSFLFKSGKYLFALREMTFCVQTTALSKDAWWMLSEELLYSLHLLYFLIHK